VGPAGTEGFPLPRPRPSRSAESPAHPTRKETARRDTGRRRFWAVPIPEVVVRVLGPVEVIGASRPFRRPWCLELVTYLALHPAGATTDSWSTALWPEELPSDASRFSTVSEARRALGLSPDGAEHLPRANGRLRLGPGVSTDWEQFRSLSAARGPGALDAWAAALSLVRGVLFAGLRSVDWAYFEGLHAEIERAVVAVAIGAAERLLASGDGRGAELAVRRGLLASPYDERLYRLLFLAADLQGNPAGVEAAMSELLRLVSGDATETRHPTAGRAVDPAVWVHPETVAVYRSLSRHRRHRVATGDVT